MITRGRCWNDGRLLNDGTEAADSTPARLHAEEFDRIGPDLVLCLVCINDRATYENAVRHAKKSWWT